MRVLLIRPPFKGTFEEYTAPPLGLAYIASVVEKGGHEVKIIDGTLFKVMESEIRSFSPDMVGLTGLTVSIGEAFDVAKMVKDVFPDIFIILGGPHATLAPHETLREVPFIDAVVHGEGEYTASELMDFLSGKKKLSEIKGISYRRGKVIRNTGIRPFIKNLDEIPFPAYHLLPMKAYPFSPKTYKRKPGTSMITSRGCPYRCAFCYKHIFGNVYRYRSPKNVVDEIKYLIDNYGMRDIFFRDDTFTVMRKRVIEICERMKEEKLDVTWTIVTRVDKIDLGLLKVMKRSGCWRILLGIETASQRLLDLLKKDITISQIKSAVKACKKVGIQTDGFFMLGLPGETREDAERTIEFAKSLGLDYAQFYLTIPYPGTELFEVAPKYGKMNIRDWRSFDQYGSAEPIFVTSGRTGKGLRETQKRAWREFYFRPSFITNQLFSIRSFDDAKTRINGLKSLISFK